MWETNVFIFLKAESEAVPAGRLALEEEGIKVISSQFGYGKRYLERKNAAPIDPISLPLEGAVSGQERLYAPANDLEMFGAVRDAMPDAWGRRVIENKLRAEPNSLRESDYLMHAGSNRFGALDFRADIHDKAESRLLPGSADLPYLLDAAEKVQNHEPVPEHLRQIFDAGPSMGGARPKAIIARNGRAWLAKFEAKGDPFNIPTIEQASLELARRCGLNVPRTELLTVANEKKVMLIERFDRAYDQVGHEFRRHVVSALTLMGLHESESPDSSYAAIADRLAHVGAKDSVKADREELFARMVFNILVSNDDDHLRNHAFIWDDEGNGWRLSPLYDVLPKPQRGTERYLHLGVGVRGRLATLDNALTHAGRFGLLADTARAIIERVSMEVREWRTFFEGEMGVPLQECEKVASAFRKSSDIGG
jgi:serine/threonine-protein kinase HipA